MTSEFILGVTSLYQVALYDKNILSDILMTGVPSSILSMFGVLFGIDFLNLKFRLIVILTSKNLL